MSHDYNYYDQKIRTGNATSIVQPFFTKKMPPLSCIQMRLKDKRLELFTSLGFEGGSAYAAIPVSFKGKDMSALADAGRSGFCGCARPEYDHEMLELTFSETSLVIKDIGSCSTLKLLQSSGLAEDTFPRQDAAITLDGLNFAHMVRVGEAASDDIARATLTGLYLHADPAKNEITSVAADGFILSIATLAVKTNSASETLAGVYSADALARLVRAVKPAETDIAQPGIPKGRHAGFHLTRELRGGLHHSHAWQGLCGLCTGPARQHTERE